MCIWSAYTNTHTHTLYLLNIIKYSITICQRANEREREIDLNLYYGDYKSMTHQIFKCLYHQLSRLPTLLHIISPIRLPFRIQLKLIYAKMRNIISCGLQILFQLVEFM